VRPGKIGKGFTQNEDGALTGAGALMASRAKSEVGAQEREAGMPRVWVEEEKGVGEGGYLCLVPGGGAL
jgi:hypothetical protein